MRWLILAALLAGCPHPKPEEPAAKVAAKDAGTAVHDAIEQWRQGYEVRSLDALSKLYAHDLDVVVVQNGQAQIGWSAIEARRRTVLASPARSSLAITTR